MGARLHGHRRHGGQDSNFEREMHVRPGGNGDLNVALPASKDCSADGAICAEDGRKLSTRLEFTVSGPGHQTCHRPSLRPQGEGRARILGLAGPLPNFHYGGPVS